MVACGEDGIQKTEIHIKYYMHGENNGPLSLLLYVYRKEVSKVADLGITHFYTWSEHRLLCTCCHDDDDKLSRGILTLLRRSVSLPLSSDIFSH